MIHSLRRLSLGLCLVLAPLAHPAARGDDQAGKAKPAQSPLAPDDIRRLFQQPGEDPPQPFVPLKPRSVEDRKQIEALQLYASARAMEEQRRLRDAIDLLEKAQKADPNSVAILRRLATLQFILRQDDKALATSKQVLNADPNDTATLAQLIKFYLNRKNDPAAAEKLLTEFLANPKLVKTSSAYLIAQFELGKLYAGTLQRIDKAADAFAKVVEALDDKAANRLSPADQQRILGNDEAGTYLLFGQVFLAANRPELAVTALQRGLVYDPDHPLIPVALAELLLQLNKPADALTSIERYLKRQPQGREGYELLARTLAALKREHEIIPRFEDAARLDSKNIPLQYALADRYKNAGQIEKANALYRALMLQQPDIRGFAPLFATLLKEKKTEELLKLMETALTQLGRLEAMGEQIGQLIADKAYTDEVLDTGLKLLTADPPKLNRQSWLILIKIANEAQKLDKLVAIQRKMLEKFPSPLVYREIADTLRRLGKHAETVAIVEEMLAKYPNEKNSGTLLYLGQEKLTAGQIDGALSIAREAQKLDPNELVATYLIAACLSQQGKMAEAIEATRAGLKSDPTDVRLNLQLAQLLSQAGRTEDAIAHLKSVAERFPGNEELVRYVRSNLSVMYTNLGNFAKAEAELETLLEKMPDDAGINNDLGYLYADQGKNLEKAEAMIRKAVREEPDNSAYLDSLGWVLFKRGKAKEAVDPLERAIKGLTAPDATIHDHLGDVYFELKDFAKAKASWTEAESIAAKATPVDKKLPDIRKKLQSLSKLGLAPKASNGANP